MSDEKFYIVWHVSNNPTHLHVHGYRTYELATHGLNKLMPSNNARIVCAVPAITRMSTHDVWTFVMREMPGLVNAHQDTLGRMQIMLNKIMALAEPGSSPPDKGTHVPRDAALSVARDVAWRNYLNNTAAVEKVDLGDPRYDCADALWRSFSPADQELRIKAAMDYMRSQPSASLQQDVAKPATTVPGAED